MRWSRLFFGAAALIALDSAASAAEPVEYVRICDPFGAGYFYIPGSDTCLRIGGRVRYESHYVTEGKDNVLITPEFNNWTSRARANIGFDARTETGFGLLRTYIEMQFAIGPGELTGDRPGYGDTVSTLPEAYVQLINEKGLMTAGVTASIFDFWGSNTFGTRVSIDDPTQEQTQFSYTRILGRGVSASLSIEDPLSNRREISSSQVVFDDLNGNGILGLGDPLDETGFDPYNGLEIPDIVANARVDQSWGSAQIMGVARFIHDLDGIEVGDGGNNVEAGDADTVGWAVGAGVGINLPHGMTFSSQGGYSEGAIGYVTAEPLSKVFFGQLFAGDFVGPDADSGKTQAWSVRAGISGNFTPRWGFSIDGSYTEVDTRRTEDAIGPLDGLDYRHYAAVGNVTWQATPGLQIGWELGYENLFLEDEQDLPFPLDDSFDTIGAMMRIEQGF